MSLLVEIQNAAIDGSAELSTVLRKCRLLASRLGSSQLADWVTWELEGYPPDISVPKYRVMHMHLIGNFSGPFGAAIKNAPIAPYLVEQIVKRDFSKFEARESVGSIEAMIKSTHDTNPRLPLDNLAILLSDKIYQGYNCVQAWGSLSISAFADIQNGVRNRVLELSIKLFEENPLAGEVTGNGSQHKIAEAKMTQIFNTTVHGGSANLVGAANDSRVTFNITSGNFSDVAEALSSANVANSDIVELKAAVQADPRPADSKSLGPGVKAWLKKMVGKAVDGTWNISVSAGTKLAEEVVLRYYGLK